MEARTDSGNILVGITGGIGAGKSVVSRICRLLDFPVYDCDMEARMLMNRDEILKSSIQELLGNESYETTGELNRDYVASIIFRDTDKRFKLNSLVHKRVRDDVREWKKRNNGSSILFVESAILFTSGLGEMTDEVWKVEAPYNVQFERVLERDHCDHKSVEVRIKAQEEERMACEKSETVIIINDGKRSLLDQIEERLSFILKNR